MDTTEILSRGMLHGSPGKLIENFYVMVQQAAAQLAAMRGILEAERAHAIAPRRRAQPHSVQAAKGAAEPWPPNGSEPLSHIG
jgi:hypothetical protein